MTNSSKPAILPGRACGSICQPGLARCLGCWGRELQPRLRHHFVHIVDVEKIRRRFAVPGPRQRDVETGANRRRVAPKHNNPIGQEYRLLDVVRHHKNAPRGNILLRPKFDQLPAQIFRRKDIQRGERLVHEEDLWVNCQRSRKTHALFHATRQFLRVGSFKALEPHCVERLERSGMSLGMRQAPRKQGRFHVVKDSKPRE